MSTLIAIYLLTGLTAGAGFAAVYFPLNMTIRWWLNGAPPFPTNAEEHAPAPRPTLEHEQAQQLVARLHDVAMRLTHDVGQHNAAMKDVNTQLAAVNPEDGEKAIEMVLDAVDKVAQANGHLTAQLTAAQGTIQEQGKLLEAQMEDALTDSLTGIANRRSFDHEMARRYADWQRQQTPLSLLMLDVDHFKLFNDEHGHQVGDEVLRGVARVLSEVIREMDLVARYGGEEFAVILPNTDIQSAKNVADRARQAVAEAAFRCENRDFRVTTSVGLAQLRSGEETAALIGRSDAALYASKKAGRNCSHFHDGRRCLPIHAAPAPALEEKAASAHGDQVAPAVAAERPPRPAPAPTAAVAEPLRAADDDVVDQLDTNAPSGLSTRADMMNGLRRRLAERQRHDVSLSLVTFELDDFDRISDLGTRVVEFVVDVSARILAAASRKMDLVARTGESQFAIMLPSCDLIEAITPAERVRNAIASCDKLRHHGATVHFTVSAGIAEALIEDDEQLLLDRAEGAMRQAASRGGNCTYVHNGTTCEPVWPVVPV